MAKKAQDLLKQDSVLFVCKMQAGLRPSAFLRKSISEGVGSSTEKICHLVLIPIEPHKEEEPSTSLVQMS